MSDDFDAAVKRCVEVEKRFSEFSEWVKADGALSRKHKELIALALAVVKGCVWCVRRHTSASIDLGASYQEVLESAMVAVQMDGGISLTRIRQLVLLAIEEYEKGYRAERVGHEWEMVKRK